MLMQEYVLIVKDVVLAIAGVITAAVAVIGLQTWSRQLRGTANFEAASALARSTYKLRDQIWSCRSPVILKNEFPEWYSSKLDELQASEKVKAYAHVFDVRWKPVYEALQEFDAQTLESEALWGTEIRNRTDILRQTLQRLRAAIEAYIDDVGSNWNMFKSDPEFGRKIQSEVFRSGQFQNNELSNEIALAIRAIEDELKPHLKR